jgi:hypothetical protein
LPARIISSTNSRLLAIMELQWANGMH